ncbi:MAG: hypothetical protein COB49_00015 [Alphaproteobacteria bacterium]|nr:MAG: hypothetical protein COB49_00015 [Alphaproteobacteria bacterium]
MSQIRRQPTRSFFARLQERLKDKARKAVCASRFYEFRLKGKHPLRLRDTPKDPWAGSVAAGSHILSGGFYCQGRILKNPRRENGQWQAGEIWQTKDLNPIWQQHLHAFCWLRDLARVVDRTAARTKAITLTRNWLQSFDRWHDQAWAPDITGQRIINWMVHAALILDSDDLVYRSKLLNSLARQARHLYHAGDDHLRGLPRLQALSGLIMAGLYLPGGDDWLKRGTDLLTAALGQEILADGGIASRNPQDLYRALRILLMVRASYGAMGHAVPKKLDDVVRHMIPMLKSLQHGDGCLALFNGSSEQNASDLAAIFAFAVDCKNLAPVSKDGKSGFRRRHQGNTVVIMDAGPPPEREVSQQGHAGTLSFEMSDGAQRIIVNCGAASSLTPMAEGNLYKLSRSTAAHSTVILNDKNSSEIRKDGLIGRGPVMVSCARTSEQGHSLLTASHDGYLSRFGIIHHRTIYMNDLGDDLRGEDILESLNLGSRPPDFDVRFHIHPHISLTRQGAGDRVLLRLPGSEYWQFQCAGGVLAVEESLYLGDGLRLQNARQIVVSGTAGHKKTVIKWSLRRIEHNN